MEKLELKHLSAYLPYGLKIFIPIWKSERTISQLRQKSIVTEDFANHLYFTDIKPILRPLSDLTNEVYLNDIEYHIPIESIFYDYRKTLEVKMSFDVNGQLNEFWLDYPNGAGDYVAESSVTRNDWEFLYENHFDVFGLIPQGLAIDINTLNK